MTQAAPLAEIWRGDLLESQHLGHVVVCDAGGQVIRALGDADAVIYPRSSCKMVQALPLLSSGAADRYGLTPEHLALACASHNGAAIHTTRVAAWLQQLGLSEPDFRCGPQEPADIPARDGLIRAGEAPCQLHNNCSGKHAGFLTLGQYMGAGPEYVEVDHPVQQAARAAMEDTTGAETLGYGIDGCSAPNFATTLTGLARAMAWFATASDRSDRQSNGAARLVAAMMAHPELVAGESRACTAIMRAAGGKAAVKTGAEGVFVAILPEQRLGIALKVSDGATRASECAIAALLSGLGILPGDHPVIRAYANAPIRNRRGIVTGDIRPAPALSS